jgi:hypothetical protein
MTQLTPPMSNDDENKRPSTATKTRSNNESSSRKEKKSSATINPVQYRILQRGQPDESAPTAKKSQIQNEANMSENSTPSKSQRNRSKY